MNKRCRWSLVLLCLVPVSLAAQDRPRYEPTWESLNQRPTPGWFDDAKFGIFIHWGVYSVPAFADPHSQIGETYAEWYWNHMHNKSGPTWAFHLAHYGANFQYQDFADQFKAELFDPNQWAELFARSGARYVVLTSKHHEGFCLWPCPASWNWNAVDVGPHRDLAGDLSRAVVAHGLKMGFYYSLYEWYNPLYLHDPDRYVTEHMLPQMKDLVERYHPSLVWTDGEWEHPSSFWKSTEFLAWLFNDSPVRDTVAVNDRWGKETRETDGGFYTSEYAGFTKSGIQLGTAHKWEECQGMGKSFGYNRVETAEDYKSAHQLIGLLVDTVAKGGNLLLDIGPTADGRIPVIMQERLLEMGAWLKVNGEAIYGTHPWREMSEGPPGNVRYTAKGDAVYAIAEGWPGRELVLAAPRPAEGATITLLGSAQPLKWQESGGKIHIELPETSGQEIGSAAGAYTFKLEGMK
ncbi:MAG TPA: alpha-L-fucosidase [Terriglobia bacterium]|nr:alpha-L-fucosidase [Terriglobia bacterium]